MEEEKNNNIIKEIPPINSNTQSISEQNKIIEEKELQPQEKIDTKIKNENGIKNNNKKKDDNRTITNEIIDILNKDCFKKYKGEKENELTKLKILNENFEENKLLLEIADLLKIKKIVFEGINESYFNDLLDKKSIIASKFKKYNLPVELKAKLSEEEKQQFEEIDKEKKIDLEEVVFKNSKIDLYFSNIFPIINKFKLINCILPFNFYNQINFLFLTHLILENVGFINENFEHFFIQIRKNTVLRKNLKILSVKNNSIGILDLCKGVPDNQIKTKIDFPNLEIMDFSNNKVFYVSKLIINALKNIKVIDLTNNNIAFPAGYNYFISSGKKIGFLLLITKNYGLMRENNRQEYIDYLFDVIPRINYPIRNLSLINLYVGNNYTKMKELDLSKFSNSLLELDISYGNINNNDLILLLNSKLALYNLKKLNLSKNKLNEQILDLFLENNYQNKFAQLKKLNLSGNDIKFKDEIKFQNFFENYKSIKLLILKHTNFELCLNDYIKRKINRHYELERNKKYKTEFTEIDLKMQKIIDNNYYLSTKTNITINVFDINNYKYVSKIKKFYPGILDRIDIETRYFDK